MSSKIISQNCPPKALWKTLGMGGEYQPTAKGLLIFVTRKIPLNKFISSAIESVIHPPIKYQFSSNHSIQVSFVAVVIAVVSFFLTTGFIYTHVMLISINQCLLNLVFSMTKALSGQSYPKQSFYYPPLSMQFGKFCFS